MLNVDVVEDKYRDDSYLITGRLPSGMEVVIDDYYYDLREYIEQNVDMLLSFMRSPYHEQKIGINNLIFSSEKYYNVELIDELVNKEIIKPADDEGVVVLTGEYFESYDIPEKWAPLPQRGSFQALFKEPSVLKTKDGIFLLNPFHSRRSVPVERIPQKITMAGGLNLEAWISIK